MFITFREERARPISPQMQRHVSDKIVISHAKTGTVLKTYTEYPQKMRRARGLAFDAGVPMEKFDAIMTNLDTEKLRSYSAAQLSNIASKLHTQIEENCIQER